MVDVRARGNGSASRSGATLAQLRNVLELRDQLDAAWAVLLMVVAQQDQQPRLVTEDLKGQLVAELVGQPLSVETFLLMVRL
jgi:hypothetical protein